MIQPLIRQDIVRTPTAPNFWFFAPPDPPLGIEASPMAPLTHDAGSIVTKSVVSLNANIFADWPPQSSWFPHDRAAAPHAHVATSVIWPSLTKTQPISVSSLARAISPPSAPLPHKYFFFLYHYQSISSLFFNFFVHYTTDGSLTHKKAGRYFLWEIVKKFRRFKQSWRSLFMLLIIAGLS